MSDFEKGTKNTEVAERELSIAITQFTKAQQYKETAPQNNDVDSIALAREHALDALERLDEAQRFGLAEDRIGNLRDQINAFIESL